MTLELCAKLLERNIPVKFYFVILTVALSFNKIVTIECLYAYTIVSRTFVQVQDRNIVSQNTYLNILHVNATESAASWNSF
jgi:hypothetical protein